MDEPLTKVIVLSIIAIVLWGIIIWRFTRYLKYYKKFKKLGKLKNTEDFFIEVDKAIETTQDKRMKASFQQLKAVRLIRKGSFEESIKLLSAIEMKPQNKIRKVLLLNNLLCAYLLSSQLERAKELLDSNPEFRGYSSWNRMVGIAIKNTLATYEFYLGDLQKSKTTFIELLDEKMNDEHMASNYYFLGQIDLREGKNEEAKIKFNKAKELGKNTFIEIRINECAVE